MKNLAGGSGFLGAIALSVSVMFYFQPTVEATTESANNSLNNTQQLSNNNQENQTVQQLDQPLNQTNNEKSENNNVRVSDTVSYRATAYCLKGRTASGSYVRRGIVAADPRILPLGSRVQLNAGAYSGTYTVADTGGDIKGRRLDIWMPSCVEAVRFGSRKVSVSRLSRRG